MLKLLQAPSKTCNNVTYMYIYVVVHGGILTNCLQCTFMHRLKGNTAAAVTCSVRDDDHKTIFWNKILEISVSIHGWRENANGNKYCLVILEYFGFEQECT